jgi:hypothetical protein
MTDEPTKSTDVRDEDLAGEPQDSSGIGSHGRWSTVAAVAGVLLVAGGIAAFQFLSSDPATDPDSTNEGAVPKERLACPHLQLAAEAYERGDTAAFDREVSLAAEAAEDALQASGQIFGEAERIALELDLGAKRNIPRLLDEVGSACPDGG